MVKSLMISIQPQHAFNILYGKKTLELRTWIPKDYVGWVYVYVTKGIFVNGLRRNQDIVVNNNLDLLNGKVGFRFWFDEFIKLEWLDTSLNVKNNLEWLLPKLCLTKQQVIGYGKRRDLYAWHIKKLEVFDEPKELSEFYRQLNSPNGETIYPFISYPFASNGDDCLKSFELKKPPQRSVWVYGN